MIFWFVVIGYLWRAEAFRPSPVLTSYVKTHEKLMQNVVHSASVEDLGTPGEEILDSTIEKSDEETSLLKRELYQLAASYDRGFSATPKARKEASDIIDKLSAVNPTENASRGIDGDASYDKSEDVPLKAIWRMIWTSALDVVSLGASPFAGEIAYSFLLLLSKIICLLTSHETYQFPAPSAIYQVITDPPIATNVIDFIPRAQTFFPSSVTPSSLLRAEVSTRASSRQGNANRVGLVFEGVKLQPIELLGQKVDNLPPLSIDLTWQQTLFDQIAPYVPGFVSTESLDDTDKPGYFDVQYLDDELLVIRQQAPGGVFALVKVDNFDP